MPLEQLNMEGCGFDEDYGSNITGELVANMYGAQSAMPQGNIQITFPEPSSIPLTISLKWPLTPGNIKVFKDMPLKELDLRACKQLTGEWARKGVA